MTDLHGPDLDLVACWSLHQPYALLVALGWKDIETRPRRTNHRGPIGIVSTLKIDEVARALLAPRAEAMGLSAATWHVLTGITGRALAVVEVLGCRPLVPEDEPRAWFYSPDRYAYTLGARHVVDRPPAVVGHQGTFYIERAKLGSTTLHRTGEIGGVRGWLEASK